MADRIICSVSHAGGRPMLFLPDRAKHEGIPEGWVEVVADGETLQAKFVKVAVNVVTRPDAGEGNVLPTVLSGWFGEDAGQPGRSDRVVFERRGDEYLMAPYDEGQAPGPPLWERLLRADILKQFGSNFRPEESQVGVVQRTGGIFLMVTLDKKGIQAEQKYGYRFLSPTEFEWQSQNRTRQESALGRDLRRHRELGIDIHLFVRRAKKVGGKTSPFVSRWRFDPREGLTNRGRVIHFLGSY